MKLYESLESYVTPIPTPSADELQKSMDDTKNHIEAVSRAINDFCLNLKHRGQTHDASKLESPEKELFAYYGPILSKLEYGSDEYKKNLEEMGAALKHHYESNSHHPEHYKNGVDDMDLVDVIEMVMDWKASCGRMKDGDIMKSIDINAKRFNIDSQLKNIITNTVKE